MPIAEEPLAETLLSENPDLHESLDSSAVCEQLTHFGRASSLYHSLLRAHPQWVSWLLEPAPPFEELRPHTIYAEWHRFEEECGDELPDPLARLRVFRRRMSMRIAFRDVNNLHDSAYTVFELSLLADFCLHECYERALERWRERHGEPWDEDLDKPARFCAMALGKLGGQELNFSSDIDLIYFFEGEGYCRKDNAPGSYSNAQFFSKVAETMTAYLQEQTEHGFLFRVDLRLRPEGARSPLVRSFAGMENYYAAAGQSWERMAFIKARPVAGDRSLGGELLESLHSFRYPRHPPSSLISEITAMKRRTEKEVVGAENLRRDVKSGYGGIREIEFIVQTLQLLHAARFPFLQTNSTVEGLEQLVRYRLMDWKEAETLKDAYWFLRAVENRIQLREEQQRHTLPTDPDEIASLSDSFGFPDPDAFLEKVHNVRETVRAHYAELLRSSPEDEELSDWWEFFTGENIPEEVGDALRRWFGPESSEAPAVVREFVQGNRNRMLTREHVSRFTGLTRRFDQVFPSLAYPLRTLQRVSRFADAFGPRSQFLSTCTLNPAFLKVLALLFDRSDFIFELLCQFPELFEEVLRPEILRRRKAREDTLHELEIGSENRDDLEEWLWLYVKAEQVRIAIGDLLGFASSEETEESLSTLSDAVLEFLLRRLDPEQRLLAVALGKYGGNELTFGSDLDLLFVGTGEDPVAEEKIARKLVRILSYRGAQGQTCEVDLRLRPHGKDGPLVPTIPALEKYFAKNAQAWEKQVLTRARPVTGNDGLCKQFGEFIDRLIYDQPVSSSELQELWRMRGRVERERDRTDPPERSFKTGPGGLIDIEFLAQFLQLVHGPEHPEIRKANTRHLLQAIREKELLELKESEELVDNFNFLKQVEVALRRNRNAPVSIISENPEDREALARWLGFQSYDEFWSEHSSRMKSTREIVNRCLKFLGAIE